MSHADLSTADKLARAVVRASCQFQEGYGAIAFPVPWTQAPRGPAEKLSLLVENLFARGVKTIDAEWSATLDRSGDKITDLILAKPGEMAVYPLRLSEKLLRISAPEGRPYPPLRWSEGGRPIINRIAAICAEFFGDENAEMWPRPNLVSTASV